MKNIFCTICPMLVAAACLRPAFAQTSLEAWVQSYHKAGSYGNVPIALAVAGNGNVIVTGTSADEFGFKSWLTVAWSSSGNLLWTQSYHGPGDFYDDQPNAVAVDAAGNAFVAGVAFGINGDNQDYVTIKYSSTGVALWTKRYNGPGNGNDGANALAVDSSGNVFVTGISPGTNGLSSYLDYATVKYSGAGVPLWTNRYNGPANNEDGATDVAVDGSGNVFVTGISYPINGRADYATVAYSSAGVPLWTNRYNGPVDFDDYARAVTVDSSGNVFVTGESWNGSATDYATIKYSGAGVPLWTNRYHTPGSGNNFARAIAADSNGNVFVTGGASGSPGGGMATLKYSNTGTLLWTRIYKGPSAFGFFDDGRAVAVDGNGNVIVTGRSYAENNSNDGDFATVAYSNAGVPLWTQRYNGPANGDDVPINRKSLGLGPDGTVYVTGASDQDPSAERQYQFVVVKYAPSAFAIWAASYGLTGTSASATADPDSDGLANGVEFIVGGNPVAPSDSASKSPAAAVSGGYLIFTFLRDDASEVSGVTLTVESSTNLITWPDIFAIGATTAASSPGVTISENGTAPDLVTVSIPIGTEQTRFARLRVTIAP